MKLQYTYTKIRSGIILMILFACSSSCKKLVTIPAPITQLVTTNVFTNNATATSAQLAIYGQMSAEPANISRITGLSSDELFTYSTDQASLNLYANALNGTTDASTSGAAGAWASAYKYIYQENAVLEGLANSGQVNEKVRQQLTAEAVFMRAWWYFNLVNLYGDVPLVLTTDYKVNSSIMRSPKAQVYDQIIRDLQDAQNRLNSNFVDATDTTVTTERVRPTKWAATALLARVYLYLGNGHYADAETQATAVIDQPKFGLPTDLNTVFKKNSTEAIFQFMVSPTTGYAQEGFVFALTAPPNSGSIAKSTISTQLYNAFEANDKRKINWIGTLPNGANPWYFANKYKRGSTATAPSDEYTMILRLAEQYLIRAEARAQQNKLSEAISDLNAIRNRAGLGSLSVPLTQSQVLDAVAQERRAELFTEGHRWFDLKRTGQVDIVMNIVTPQKGNSWNTNQQLYPILLSDINVNHNLVQNKGY